jgi:hypothetical protein
LKGGEFKVISWTAIVAMALVHLSTMGSSNEGTS